MSSSCISSFCNKTIFMRILVVIALLLLALGVLPFAPHSHSETSNTSRKSRYILISGCNNYCSVACCYCNIHRFPPVCEKCCK
ncbi:hypothetical protein DAI22_05g101500 [Oryza sativa Japonica Group]|nr:hypothetical protein DAI22_05g101500 [Oryza sativa Japonica Group]